VGSRLSSLRPTRPAGAFGAHVRDGAGLRTVPHTFDGDERPGYVASLASVTKHDGTLYVLCFSHDGPDTRPHPISPEELRGAFNPSNGWNVAAIEPDLIQTRYHDDGAAAWFATIKRI
jgi:hypothetical protein